MRTGYRWLILLVFLVVNGFVIAWAWRSFNAPEPAPAATPVVTTDEQRSPTQSPARNTPGISANAASTVGRPARPPALACGRSGATSIDGKNRCLRMRHKTRRSVNDIQPKMPTKVAMNAPTKMRLPKTHARIKNTYWVSV